MSLDQILVDNKDVWLDTTGHSCIYRSAASGKNEVTMATVELETEVMNTEGLMVKHTTASISSVLVADVKKDDLLVDQETGIHWLIKEKYQDDGVIAGLYLTKEP